MRSNKLRIRSGKRVLQRPGARWIVPGCESDVQIQAVRWFRTAFPQHARSLFAIPNGGARSKVQGGILKAEGVLAGVWDLFLAVPRPRCSGLFIETKFGKNKLSEPQELFMAANKDSYAFGIYYDQAGFEKIIRHYLDLHT